MTIFISHNKADKITARAMATLLVAQGCNVWFDEWEIRPGQSLTGGIEEGLAKASAFILVWSGAAQASNWVGTELRAYLRRRVDDDKLLVIPIMVDGTKLPILVADYRGFDLSDGNTRLEDAAQSIAGNRGAVELAQLLQTKLHALAEENVHKDDPFGILICPRCGSDQLRKRTASVRDDEYYTITCENCSWSDWTQ